MCWVLEENLPFCWNLFFGLIISNIQGENWPGFGKFIGLNELATPIAPQYAFLGRFWICICFYWLHLTITKKSVLSRHPQDTRQCPLNRVYICRCPLNALPQAFFYKTYGKKSLGLTQVSVCLIQGVHLIWSLLNTSFTVSTSLKSFFHVIKKQRQQQHHFVCIVGLRNTILLMSPLCRP